MTTDAGGQGSFTFQVPALATGVTVSATATDAAGNTSEFSVGTPGPSANAVQRPQPRQAFGALTPELLDALFMSEFGQTHRG